MLAIDSRAKFPTWMSGISASRLDDGSSTGLRPIVIINNMSIAYIFLA